MIDTLKLPRCFQGQSVRNPGVVAIIVSLISLMQDDEQFIDKRFNWENSMFGILGDKLLFH